MDASTAAVLTGTVVTVGRWSQGKGLEAKVVIGAGVFAIGLSAIAASQPDFAGKLGALVLTGALLTYGVPIAKALGTSNTGPIMPGRFTDTNTSITPNRIAPTGRAG